jgi:hypothetical protein
MPWPFLFFLFYEIFFTESYIGLSANIHCEEDRQLSAKRPSPVTVRREAFAESIESFAEMNLALSEGPESGSVFCVSRIEPREIKL